VAIGGNAQASAANSVALGANATTTANLGLAAFNPGTGAIAGMTPVGEVSVGSAGAERRVTNLAAGAAPTDAVNVSQLQAVSSQVSQVQQDALLWDPTVNGGAGAFSANHGGNGPNTITNVASAALNATSSDAVNGSQLFATNQNVTNIANEVDTINNGAGVKYFRANSTAADSQATGADSVSIGPLAVAGGASSLAAGNGAQTQSDNALALGAQSNVSVAGGVAIGSSSVSDRAVTPGVGSIPAGSQAVPFNTSDATLLGAVSFGSAAGNTYRQLTNVADGTQPHDAATIRQLTGALQSFAVTPTLYFHANSAAADSLAVGDQSVAVGPTTVVNGDNGIGIGNGAQVQQTAPGGLALGEAANSSQADAIAVGSGATASGPQSIAQGANASALQVGAIAVGSGAQSNARDAVAIGASANATFANSVALGAGSATTVGALSNYIAYGLSSPQSSAGEVNVGNRQITGLAAGEAGTDAVNVSQLDAVANQLTTLIQNNHASGGSGGPFTSNPGSSSQPASTGSNSSAGGLGAVASGNNSSAVGNGSQATGSNSTAVGVGATSSGNSSAAVGAGSDDGGRSNVVSVGTAVSQRQVTNVAAATDGTDAVNLNQLNAGIAQANGYTDQRIDALQGNINSVARNAYSGIAAATALTMIPEVDNNKTLAMGIGTAGYRGYQAVAIGASARITQNIKMKAGVGIAPGGDAVGVGASMQW
jgi:autotransporter adhesin